VKAEHAVKRLEKDVAREMDKSRSGSSAKEFDGRHVSRDNSAAKEFDRRRVSSVKAVIDGRIERQGIRSVNTAEQKPPKVITQRDSKTYRLAVSPKRMEVSTGYAALRPKTNASAAVARARNKAAKVAAGKSRRAAAVVRKKVARGTAKTAVRIVKAAMHGLAALAKALIPALIAAAPVARALLLVAVLALVVLSPFGVFFSGNGDNPNKVPEIVSAVEAEWDAELLATRAELESRDYVVNVYYGDPAYEDDSSRVNNWKDVISLYAVSSSDGDVSKIVLTDDDTKNIRDLYFAMNTASVHYRTEITETEVQREVRKERWVFNSRTGRFEKEYYMEIEMVTESTSVEHADIWVDNKRYPEMLSEYPLAREQQDMLLYLMSYENEGLWELLGIRTLEDCAAVTDPDIITRHLPPGTLGTAIVEEAAKHLGMPYRLGGNGNGVIDCSGLVVAVYGKFGISFGNRTAASQAQWCVDNGKVVDAGAVRAGDLIFYSSGDARVADRFMNVGHVGIAVGDGTMIDASSSNGCVVHRRIYGSPALYGRPHV
jgi:hypothetical protein